MDFAYYIKFKNGEDYSFQSDVDINFHELKPGYIAFDDLLICFDEVLYMIKRRLKNG